MAVDEKNYDRSATIAAIATPPGEGGVAIVRISGPKALAVANLVFSRPLGEEDSHRVRYGQILTEDAQVIDQVLAIPFCRGRSYTGEETVELHCHGGSLIARKVLERVLEGGAVGAKPGEFTYRAFMNGKLDLAQAEAVQAVIGAKSEKAMHAAREQLQGRLSDLVRQFQKELTEIAAILEAWVDFPEEGLEFATPQQLVGQLARLVREMEQLLATFEQGRILHEGFTVCLVGSPNVGKSSLMNALLERERAIVTAIPGTTRDTLEDYMSLGGFHLRLIDTAGIRQTEEEVEKEGIKRSHLVMEEADIVLLLKDATAPDEELSWVPPKHIVVWNKIDLVDTKVEGLAISAKHRIGLEELLKILEEKIRSIEGFDREEVSITHLRHKEALNVAVEAVLRGMQGLEEGISPEFLCFDLREALHALGRILGTDVTEDIITEIFSRFCLGK
ncbi:MAG: tRNA uridine-5-carboxymethylaminomethyl(34) synthesis GTPase MnmE [Verrucomicrobia bacterium]|nr:tRNA uridine-5-carboxymethylaminomethyl(34) synthesis GTPase MnmE [Verrucomicrobiota bacterium]